jgi:tetratricopeptide (TPR) repeat protein
VDQPRREASRNLGYVFLPSADAVQVACMGFDQLAASALWVRAVLMFVELVDAGRVEDVLWFKTMLGTISILDVRWRTPYFYGGSMLRLMGDVDASDEEYQAGMDALPLDPYFPFSLGMNAYIYRKDYKTAIAYLEHAASLPTAPKWYRTAAAGFLKRSGEHRAALRYLDEQLEFASSEREREILLNKRNVFLHEAIGADLEEKRAAYESKTSRTLTDLRQFEELPADPFGGEWIVSIDGHIRSSVYDKVIAARNKFDERGMLTQAWQGPRP